MISKVMFRCTLPSQLNVAKSIYPRCGPCIGCFTDEIKNRVCGLFILLLPLIIFRFFAFGFELGEFGGFPSFAAGGEGAI